MPLLAHFEPTPEIEADITNGFILNLTPSKRYPATPFKGIPDGYDIPGGLYNITDDRGTYLLIRISSCAHLHHAAGWILEDTHS